jgi:thiol-disulfide isomerase/thioredoxin
MGYRARGLALGAASLLILAVGIAFFIGLGYASDLTGGAGEEDASTGTGVGDVAPDFELERIDGGTLRLSDLRGKPVLVNFWATWCGPCVLEMPNIQKYYEQFPGEFEVVAVNSDESKLAVEKFVKNIGVTFPVVLDPRLLTQSQYRPRGLPTTFILDGEGKVLAQHIGLMSEKNLAGYLEQAGLSP